MPYDTNNAVEDGEPTPLIERSQCVLMASNERLTLRFKWSWIVAMALAIVIATVLYAEPALAETAKAADALPQESFLLWVARCSGTIGVVILLLSFYFVATVVRLFLDLRETVAAPKELLETFEAYYKNRDFRGLYEFLKIHDCFLANVLAAGMLKLSNGLQEARNTLDRASDAATISLEKSCSMLAVLGTLGPMIGLLGTLKGMIASFSVIAMSDVQLKANQVAGGISEALLLTFEGVLLSVPSIYFYAFFRNRVASISANVTLLADNYLGRLADVWRKKQEISPPSLPAAGN